jgi:hypothetical protein
MDTKTNKDQPRMRGLGMRGIVAHTYDGRPIYGDIYPMTEEEREEAEVEAHMEALREKQRREDRREDEARAADKRRKQYWKLPLSERLLEGSLFKPDTECRIWIRSRDGQGFGTMGLNGKRVKVHRVSFEAVYGVTSGDLIHVCKRKACINPDHIVVKGKGQRDFQHIPLRPGLDWEWRKALHNYVDDEE